jgi:hypothetical protein
VAALLLLACAGTVHAEKPFVDVSFNNDTARIGFGMPVFNRALLDGNWLHSEDEGDVVGVGISRTGLASPGANPVTAALGARFVYANPDEGNADGTALALGGAFHWKFPRYDRFGVGGEIYFAPSVLSFGDSSGYDDASLHVSYDIFQDAWLYLGVRHVKMRFEDESNVTFDTGLHVGVHIGF